MKAKSKEAWRQYSYLHSGGNQLAWKEHVNVRLNVSWNDAMPDLTSCERCIGRVFTLCLRPVRLKGDSKHLFDSSTSRKLEGSDFGLEKCGFLHSFVGGTADVSGNHHQAARMDAGHDADQIDLEPQLKVFRLKGFKFRSKGCQGQVQDGVSCSWICDEGDVSLQMKGFILITGC